VSAAFHWVGSEGTWRSGLGPRHWRPFEASVPEAEKVDRILAWLDLTEPDERPRLITSWFRGADHVAHRHGPDSRQVSRALRRQDDALAHLVRGLRQRRLLEMTTLLVVSDHGMSPVTRVVDLQAALERNEVRGRVLGGGGFAMVSLGGSEQAERVLEIARRLGLEAHRRAQAPRSLRLAHPRFGDVVVLAPIGTAISRRAAATGFATRLVSGLLTRLGSAPLALRGAHGYPAEVRSMGALFVAAGRGVTPGTQLGVVRGVDVAPTVLALLDLSVPSWMEGEPIAAIVPSRQQAVRGSGSKAGEAP
jgi:arylsulfatase A-like enzyme